MSEGFVEGRAPNQERLPGVRNIFDVSAEFLGELKTWLEENPPSIPVTQIVGYQSNVVKVFKKIVTPVAVNTTTTATALVNEQINANQLATDGRLRLTCYGDWVNNTPGAVVPPRFLFAFGGTTLIDTNVAGTTYNSDATRREWELQVTISSKNATNAQGVIMRGFIALGTQATGGSTTAFATGNGAYVIVNNPTTFNVGTFDGGAESTVDVTVANALTLKVINGSANAAYETKLLGALIEVI